MQIASEHNYQVLFPLLVFAYNFLNPSDVGVGAFGFTSYIAKPTSIYDLMKTHEKMASLVKEQLNHFMLKKVTKEVKNPLEWWRVHEVQFSYVGFVTTNFKDCWFVD